MNTTKSKHTSKQYNIPVKRKRKENKAQNLAIYCHPSSTSSSITIFSSGGASS
jgi:hypothetical protein